MTTPELCEKLREAARSARESRERLREIYRALDVPTERGRTCDLAEIAAIHIGAFAADLESEADYLERHPE